MDKKHGGSQKTAEAPELITNGTLKVCFEEENEPKIAGLSIEEADENVDAKYARLLHDEYWKSMKQKKSEALVLINNCNVLSRDVMDICGDMDDCISRTNYNAAELAAALDEKVKNDLPLLGQVEFINGRS